MLVCDLVLLGGGPCRGADRLTGLSPSGPGQILTCRGGEAPTSGGRNKISRNSDLTSSGFSLRACKTSQADRVTVNSISLLTTLVWMSDTQGISHYLVIYQF